MVRTYIKKTIEKYNINFMKLQRYIKKKLKPNLGKNYSLLGQERHFNFFIVGAKHFCRPFKSLAGHMDIFFGDGGGGQVVTINCRILLLFLKKYV